MQNAPDGVNREQAVAYQQFVLDFQLLCLLAGKANGQWFSADYESRLESMLDYLASIMDAGGNVPMFGDADDGFAVRLAPQDGLLPYRSLLATGALLFRRGDFRQKARTLDDKTRWLFGAAADAEFAALDAQRDAPADPANLPRGRLLRARLRLRHARARSAWWPMPGRSATARSRRTATPTRSAFSLSAARPGVPHRSGHLRVPHPGALAELLPRHLRAQHGAPRRARPVGAGRQLHVAVARRAPAAACGCPRRRRTASRAGTTATCASTTR